MAFSQRRFPRLRSTFAQALFLHRIWPRATWTDELIRNPEAYEHPGSPEWVSGACMLIRREALEAVERPRRGLLPLLRGHRPVRPDTQRGMGDRLRAGGEHATRGRRVTAPRAALPRVRPQQGPVHPQARSAAQRPAARSPASRWGTQPTRSHRLTRPRVAYGHMRAFAAVLLGRRAFPGVALTMCGIAGAFRDRRRPRSAAALHVLRRMTERSSTAAPTMPASSSTTGCSLGARRLSIIDVEGGHQPFATSEAASGPRRTARSTTTSASAPSSSSAATRCGAAATPRSSRTSTRSTARS